jgi:hypothetical protein
MMNFDDGLKNTIKYYLSKIEQENARQDIFN